MGIFKLREQTPMRTKTNLKAGFLVFTFKLVAVKTNHSETLVRDSGKSLKIKTALRAGKKAK
jgi:hypothetical protein